MRSWATFERTALRPLDSVERVVALGVDDGLQAALGADHHAVVDDRARGLLLAVEAVVDALVGALDDVALLLGERACSALSSSVEETTAT